VGAPKTGTVSLAGLFAEYRSAHEPHLDGTLELIKAQCTLSDLRRAIRKRDRQWRLECEVGFFLVHVSEALVSEFPDAKFICTVRPPKPWLRSIINLCINHPREELTEGYLQLRDYCFGAIPETYSPQEQILSQFDLHSLDGYLSYWANHYRTVLGKIPKGRCLFLRTKNLSDVVEQIADFVEVKESSLQTDESHAHRTSKKHGILDEIEGSYLREKIDSHCGTVIDRLDQETQISLQPV
jgi:hypothetical protein